MNNLAIISKLNKEISFSQWDDDFFRKVKIDFTYNSNKLEGNTLIYGQTIKLLKGFVTLPNAAMKDKSFENMSMRSSGKIHY